MQTNTIKHVLISIFVGACVAFISSLAQGLVHALQSIDSGGTGGMVGMLTYLVKAARHTV